MVAGEYPRPPGTCRLEPPRRVPGRGFRHRSRARPQWDGTFHHLTTHQVRFHDEGDNPVPLERVPPLVLSEIMRTSTCSSAFASVGNDPNWVDGGPISTTRVLRKLPLVRADALRRDEEGGARAAGPAPQDRRSLFVHRPLPGGPRRPEYVQDPPRQRECLDRAGGTYLCIVPKSAPGGIFLPFEGDETLSIIVSKAFLLADDTRIRDRSDPEPDGASDRVPGAGLRKARRARATRRDARAGGRRALGGAGARCPGRVILGRSSGSRPSDPDRSPGPNSTVVEAAGRPGPRRTSTFRAEAGRRERLEADEADALRVHVWPCAPQGRTALTANPSASMSHGSSFTNESSVPGYRFHLAQDRPITDPGIVGEQNALLTMIESVSSPSKGRKIPPGADLGTMHRYVPSGSIKTFPLPRWILYVFRSRGPPGSGR